MTRITLFPPFVLATDGSASARLAQKLLSPMLRALQIAAPETTEPSAPEALLTVLTVQPRRSRQRRSAATTTPALAPASEPPKPESAAVQSPGEPLSPEALSRLIQDDLPPTIPFTVQIRQGRPATEILSYATAIGAGLIAVGHRGTGGVRELLLGSVSTVVARYAPCSVLIARGTVREATLVEAKIGHVLIVVDEFPASRSAIAAARQLLPAGVEQVTLLYIQPPLTANYLFGPFASPNPSWNLQQSLQDAQRDKAEQRLRRSQAALDQPNLAIQTRIHNGEPGPSICQVALDEQVDLVILGSDPTRRSLLPPLPALRGSKRSSPKQRQPLRNTRLSVTDDYVIHYAPCPVLLCRVTASAQPESSSSAN